MLHNSPFNSRLFSTEESRDIDQTTIGEYGISGFTLMEIAASGAAQVIFDVEHSSKTGLFLCGKGNNAGDALAVARYLCDHHQHKVNIVFLQGTDGLTADTRLNYEILKKLAKNNPDIRFFEDSADAMQSISEIDYIVDGIFGTGLKSEPREPISEIINLINSTNKPTYSMDVPTGLNATTGVASGTCIKASHTITFGTNKVGFYLNGSAAYTGTVHIIRLPFPETLLQSTVHLLEKDLFESTPGLTRDALHKYDNGVVHLLAGSEGLTGAAIIAAKSAVKHGAGAVFLYTPKKLLPIYEITLPEVIKIPLGDEADSFYKTSHQEKILDNLSGKPGVLVAGPGTGTRPETMECLANILKQYTEGAIIDADALKLFRDPAFEGSTHSDRWLLTPHPGEAKKYLGIEAADDYQKMQSAGTLSKRLHTNILLKGNPVMYTDPENHTMITGYDTSMFTKAGFGDYLAGAISAQYSIRNSLRHAIISVLYGSFAAYRRLNSPKNFNPSSLLKDEFDL